MGRANAPGRAASYGRRQAALAALSRRALAGATLPDLAADSLDAVVAIVGVPLAAVITVEPQGHSPTILAAHGIPGGASDGSWIALTTVPRPTRHPGTGAGSAGADVDAGASRATDPDSTADPSRTTDPDSTADPSRTTRPSRTPSRTLDASSMTDASTAPDASGVSDPMLDPDALAARVAGALEAFARHDVAAAPVRYAGRPVAIVVAARRDRRDFTAGDRAFVGDVADLLSLALAHASDREATEVAHDARFQGLIDSDANGLLMVDEYGRIVEANRRAAELFGYEPRELVGTSIERLVPDRVRPIHARHRSTYVAAPATRPMGVGRDLTARRKDGTEFPVEIGLSSFPVAGRRLVTAIVADITSRKAAESALAESERRFRTVLEAAPNAMVAVDEAGRIAYVNPQVEQTFGYPAEALLGRPIELLLPERARERHAVHREGFLARPNSRPMGIGLDLAGRRADGTEFPVEISLSPVATADGPLVFAAVVDITARKSLEEQLLQAQKMESVGRLAGGVAHDFNNILTTISGYSQLLLSELADKEERLDRDGLVRNIGFIRDAASRAASLTHQLLAFSRRQVLRPQVIDLNRTVAEIEPMLRPLLGERVEIVHVLDPAVGRIRADPGQLDQIIVNLAVNARDAMPDGGTLTIETQNASFDEGYAIEHFDVTAGDYVVLAVSDTGVGMDRETRTHVFEPFFTTKELGKGTGLGLATIYGIVRQSGGHIWLYSEPGQGTTFKIYLPRTDETALRPRGRPVQGASGRERGSVLLVEDDDSVRQYARIVLERAGYAVIEASNGALALELAAGVDEPLAALVTDVIMPKMTGPRLAEELQERMPGLPVVYVSGYTSEAADAQGMLGPNVVFLGKPFSSESLLAKLAEARHLQRAADPVEA